MPFSLYYSTNPRSELTPFIKSKVTKFKRMFYKMTNLTSIFFYQFRNRGEILYSRKVAADIATLI